MGLQEEEDYNNTNWEWRKKSAATDQLPNISFSKYLITTPVQYT